MPEKKGKDEKPAKPAGTKKPAAGDYAKVTSYTQKDRIGPDTVITN